MEKQPERSHYRNQNPKKTDLKSEKPSKKSGRSDKAQLTLPEESAIAGNNKRSSTKAKTSDKQELGLIPVKPSSPESPEVKGSGKLLNQSAILNNDIFENIRLFLPVRLRGKNWKRLFSTEVHGTSWTTFYSNISSNPLHSSETIIVVKDSSGESFGLFATEDWVVKEGFFGTGECFVFKTWPTFKCWLWDPNYPDYWQIATKGHIGIGAEYALCIYEGFTEGTSNVSPTFKNECLARTTSFIITVLEVWCLVRGAN